jgi:hypothetical protein
MSEVEDFRRQADECFRKAESAVNEFSRAFWLGLSKKWAMMVDEAEPARPSIASNNQLAKLQVVIDEALFEKALALSAARVTGSVDAQRDA